MTSKISTAAFCLTLCLVLITQLYGVSAEDLETPVCPDLEAKVSSLEKELNDSKAETARVTTEVSQLKASVQGAESEAAECSGKLEKSTAALAEAMSASESSAKEVAALQSKAKDAAALLEESKEQKAKQVKLEAEVKALQASLEEAEKVKTQLKGELQASLEDAEKAKTQLKGELQSTRASCESDAADKAQSASKINKALETKKEEYKVLEGKVASLTAKLAESEHALDNLDFRQLLERQATIVQETAYPIFLKAKAKGKQLLDQAGPVIDATAQKVEEGLQVSKSKVDTLVQEYAPKVAEYGKQGQEALAKGFEKAKEVQKDAAPVISEASEKATEALSVAVSKAKEVMQDSGVYVEKAKVEGRRALDEVVSLTVAQMASHEATRPYANPMYAQGLVALVALPLMLIPFFWLLSCCSSGDGKSRDAPEDGSKSEAEEKPSKSKKGKGKNKN
eukprot:CAMPEP_0197849244 /NCGR_PEP_ID=MMETSP1438-20131217/11360_1 /TAXON_ID=1461541 /ORGANISM="Pterosperma sp., Strain CCMP1384" /LENGTH=452 /DNA_ID=CAMNT_0043461831 /DNA_START=72 /DNA_END=1430 /DNA_ORIENTATION=-